MEQSTGALLDLRLSNHDASESEPRVELSLVTSANPAPPPPQRRVENHCRSYFGVRPESMIHKTLHSTMPYRSREYRFGKGYHRPTMMNYPRQSIDGGFTAPTPWNSLRINGVSSAATFANNSPPNVAVNRPTAASAENKDASGIDLTLRL
ncbi:hypothetical protein V6N11_006185 [Hibiscus sabdariffa]|uniref:Uncharacterized protein n=1 Tax=Hibiscus sabdariffa TaxID=183260 RepID=A0ABR2RQD0_9ROSI